ncbi:hypothetical protein QWY92_05855 [Algibacter miyuki]|nr:hypothetical protein [Algibacter miyuki]MDN3664934.1 hypothetical protein [Algibacter miyuki]
MKLFIGTINYQSQLNNIVYLDNDNRKLYKVNNLVEGLNIE